MCEIHSEHISELLPWSDPPNYGVVYSGKVIEKSENFLIFITKNNDNILEYSLQE